MVGTERICNWTWIPRFNIILLYNHSVTNRLRCGVRGCSLCKSNIQIVRVYIRNAVDVDLGVAVCISEGISWFRIVDVRTQCPSLYHKVGMYNVTRVRVMSRDCFRDLGAESRGGRGVAYNR